MKPYLSPGRGLGQSSYYSAPTGLPNNECKWYVDQSKHDKVVSISSAIGLDPDSVLFWAQRREAERVSLDSGETRVVAAIDFMRGLSSQVAKSEDCIMAGPLLLNADDFSVLSNFEEMLVPGSASSHELVNIPVVGGFLYLTGNRIKAPRDLYFVDAKKGELHLLGGGYNSVIALPGSEVYFAIRDGQLMCGHARTGEMIWQKTVSWQWSEHSSEDDRNESRINAASMKCSETEVMLFLSGAGFYRFDARSGELIYHLDTYYDSVGFGGARYFRECDTVFFGPDLYYVVHCNEGRTNALRAYSFHNNNLIFEQSAEGGYEFPLFIAGDLFFFVDSKVNAYIARDRHSGELVWQSKDYLPRTYFGLPVGNKIFIYGGAGHMICYEWSEPYISPHRLTE